MRIPSQFNEDSLYRRGRRRDETSQNYRRLARLVIGLALVVVVMRQSSRPEIYRTFFGPPVATAVNADPSGTSQGESRSPMMAAIEITPGDRNIANHLVGALLPSDQQQWSVALSRWQTQRPVTSVPSTVESVENELAAMQLSDEDRLTWKVMLESFVNSTSGDAKDAAPSSKDQPRVGALLAALDDAAASRVVDGSVWRSGDFDLFYRFLDQAETLSAEGVAATGVLPLLQQPDVFRNQTIRAHGTVAKIEQIEARENAYGVESYWQLWLRPADGADRPLIAIVPSVPASIWSPEHNAMIEDGPMVTVVGRFLKRLAYESSIGADLAPVVIGRLAWAPATPESLASAADTESTEAGKLWLIILGAGLVGFALAAVNDVAKTSAMARRSRELRTAHRVEPNDFLSDLKSFDSASARRSDDWPGDDSHLDDSHLDEPGARR